MSWETAFEPDAALRAALAGQKNLVCVGPPAWWVVLPLAQRLPDLPQHKPHTLILAPDQATTEEGAAVLRASNLLQPVHAVTGLDRAARLLTSDAAAALAVTPPDLLHLLAQSRLDLTAVTRLIVCWPEWHTALGLSSDLDTILAEAAGAQRIIVTANAAMVAAFLERHARRAPVQTVSQPPPEPVGRVRYVMTGSRRLFWTARDVLDALNPSSVFVWEPVPARCSAWHDHIPDPWVHAGADPGSAAVDLVIAADLPSAEVLANLREVGEEVLVLLRPPQLAYLEALAERIQPIRLPSEADRAHDRTARFREQVRDRLRQATPDAALLALAPLFDQYDPALVAAAVAAPTAVPEGETTAPPALPAWVRIRIAGGNRDRIRTGDVVGALLNAVGLTKKQVGRVEIRDTFSLIEIQAEAANKALAGLSGLIVRGKKLEARIDQR